MVPSGYDDLILFLSSYVLPVASIRRSKKKDIQAFGDLCE